MTSADVLEQRARARRRFDMLRALRRLDAIGRGRFAALAVLAYVVLALFAYLPAWPGDPQRLVGCACGDPAQQAWYLGWVPWALLHGHNPFFTTWMEYPTGVNLAANTEMPLLGLLSAPISLLFGSVSSFSFLLWLSYPLSATALFFALRRWTGSNLAGFTGGLLYGFSAYVVAEGLGHLNLAFVPLPPLILMALHEVLVRQRARARSWGVLLGLLVAAQFLISSEVLGMTIVVAGCGAVILVIACHREIDRARLAYAWRSGWPALLIVGVLCAYPVYFQFLGPLSIHGPVQRLMNPYRADLLGVVVPSSGQRIAPGFAVGLSSRFTASDVSETGSYLGIPLVLLAVWCAFRYRRDRWVLFAAALAVITYMLSLGPTAVVAAHQTSVLLPFDLLGRIPIFDNILPTRFALFQSLFVALLVGLALASAIHPDEQRCVHAQRRRPIRRRTEHSPRARPTPLSSIPTQVVLVVLSLLAIVALVPRWPTLTAQVAPAIPRFFTSAAAKQIPVGGVVLTYPFVVGTNNEAMLWQAADDWRWKLVGGYAATPKHSGTGATPWPPTLHPVAVQAFLGYWTSGTGDYLAKVPPAPNARLVRKVQDYVRRHGIGTVVVELAWPSSAIVVSVLQRALGCPLSEGGVDVWLRAAIRGPEIGASADPPSCMDTAGRVPA